MHRPFFTASIADLEEHFRSRARDVEFLRALVDELGHRTSDRASRLRSRAFEALKAAGAGDPNSGRQAPPPPSRTARGPRPPAGSPEAVMDAWTALEVLSPQSFRRAEDLTGGEEGAVARLDRGRLPWEGGERPRPGMKLFYQVLLGTVDMEKAVDRLLARYTDRRAERPAARGHAIVAVCILDGTGRPAAPPAISSFGWGLPRALDGDLAALAEWPLAEAPLVDALGERLRRETEDGEILPLDRATLDAAFDWLVAALGVPRDLAAPPRVAIRSYQGARNDDPPDPILLNSFFLGDLAAARALWEKGRAPAALRRYVGELPPPRRRDLLRDTAALEVAVAPEATPPARWPGPGRHPLVLLQQAAVNLALDEVGEGGILAVNGPPGTGKTTLLRDVVAGLVAARAEAMLAFDDPADAFQDSGESVKAGQGRFQISRLDARLKGFEMVVASSNNRAVENVSAELPALGAVAEDADVRYFAPLSDALAKGGTWGLIAAVLGNAANRGRFRQTFWWDEDVGLSSYLIAAAGTPRTVEARDPATGETHRRPPRIVTEAGAPSGPDEARRRWSDARSRFRAALAKSRTMLDGLARVRALAASVAVLARAERKAAEELIRAREAEERARRALGAARAALPAVEAALAAAQRRVDEHDAERPGFFARLVSTPLARAWRSIHNAAARQRDAARAARDAASRSVSDAERALRDAGERIRGAARDHAAAVEAYAPARREMEAHRARLGPRMVDEAFFARTHAERHRATPWLAAADQALRDEVFAAAMALHKAFADAAAKPLRHNLGALMGAFGGRGIPGKEALMTDLWASFFLVVPLVSTTFASVERMFGALGPEALGWLLIDEAGQAAPQAAVGALMRARRAVVVGDPMQVQPVVSLPDTLTEAICRELGADPDRFNAPAASAQTLADAATPYLAELEGRHGSRTVGVPLLVHRRCADPMFSISNAVAYEHLMVQAKAPHPSRIGDVLGPSAWIHVEGSVQDKWCPGEGAVAVDLLRRLAAAGVDPDVYVVTPFVVVAENLRKLVRADGLLSTRLGDAWTRERVGTVHTVQGREAEAVIFVLGAQGPKQGGAREWAGWPPNLLNVAVTRAKERLYVVGNRLLWRGRGAFRELDTRFPRD